MAKNSKKPTRSKIVKKLDTVFSEYIRKSRADKNGYCQCITCSKTFHWKKIQAGHFMSRKHYSTRWDEDNVFPQCVACNMFRSGEQYLYSLALGKEKSEEMLQKSRMVHKFSTGDLEVLIKYYQDQLSQYNYLN